MRRPAIGIDLLSIDKSARFLKVHGRRKAARLLAFSELRYCRRHRFSPKAFGRLIAAKEAYFKALGGNWLGLPGFSLIEVKCLPQSQFKVESWQSAKGVLCPAAFGTFFSAGRLLGAQAIIWPE